jgi:hypothetical protein
MTSEPTQTKKGNQKQKIIVRSGGSDTVYGIGIIGAWVYYFKHATTNQERIQAFFKGLVWPAYLVYELFSFLEISNPVPESSNTSE